MGCVSTVLSAVDGQDNGQLVEEKYLPWLAILGALLCFGSFAVPMKWPSVMEAQVHPLIFQCYKTLWTFITSLLVIPFQGFHFTWWGLASGFSWVPAGVAAVVAVQNVGIASGQAIWQVTIIATSLVWGFAVLQDEDVYSWWVTVLSLVFLTMGVVGMTFAFNLPMAPRALGELTPGLAAADRGGSQNTLQPPVRAKSAPEVPNGEPEMLDRRQRSHSTPARLHPGNLTFAAPTLLRSRSAGSLVCLGAEPEVPSASMAVGISAALFNGIWGGFNLVPSHFSPLHGIRYVVSFSIGALVANVSLLIVYGLLAHFWWKTPLPSPCWRTMAIPGFISGTLWSAGNFCALYVVNTIGQGIGYSLVQCSVIVSGLWGILYYREMRGWPVVYWILCCAISFIGIFGLALERKP